VFKYSCNRKNITIDRYRSVIKNICEFSPGIALEDIDVQWLHKYEVWLYSRGNCDTTVWARMKVLRMLFNEAIKRDLMKPWQTQFRIFEIPALRSRTDVIRFAEMEELFNFRFTDRKLSRARDFFLFSCYTGLRWADMLSLTSEHIRKIGEETWLTIKTQKTGKLVQIPLTIIFYGRAMKILEKYKSVEDMVSYKANSSYNRLLHDLIAEAKVGGGQHITVHTARRSCITGLADFGVNVYTIQRIAGHSRINTTQMYMQLSTTSIENDLRKAFPKDKEVTIPMPVPEPDDEK
jgi:integrase